MMKRIGLLAGVVGAAGLLGVSTALAVLVATSGGGLLQVENRSENAVLATSTAFFVDIPGANAVVTVPGETTRLVTARFTGESRCAGTAGRWCSVRIVATHVTTGVSTELNPVAGIDFAFDSVATDLWESNAIERSIRLGAGTYRVRGQRAVSAAGVTFFLDDWHFRVETNT